MSTEELDPKRSETPKRGQRGNGFRFQEREAPFGPFGYGYLNPVATSSYMICQTALKFKLFVSSDAFVITIHHDESPYRLSTAGGCMHPQ